MTVADHAGASQQGPERISETPGSTASDPQPSPAAAAAAATAAASEKTCRQSVDRDSTTPLQHHQQQQQQQQQQQKQHPVPSSFEQFRQLEPKKAQLYVTQVEEVTGITDTALINLAFNSTAQKDQAPSEQFSVSDVIAWLCDRQEEKQAAPSYGSAVALPQANLNTKYRDMTPAVALNRPEPAPPAASGSGGNNQQLAPPNSPYNHRQQRDDATAPSGADSNKSPIIDLTENEDAEIKRAIALSLQDQNNMSSQEEKNLNIAIQNSYQDTKTGSKSGTVDCTNPHDRKRKETHAVGLKNVGLTCWFSSGIQSLFYLPAFRQLVLSYTPPQRPLNGSNGLYSDSNTSDQQQRRDRIVNFMIELRYLFALMLASHRKYVDPTRTVEILQGHMDQSSNAQQDVSEFTNIILDWFEQAFQKHSDVGAGGGHRDDTMDHEEEHDTENVSPNPEVPRVTPTAPDTAAPAASTQTGGSNPMRELFYGRQVVEVTEEKNSKIETRTNREDFGPMNLHVKECTDIHEALENYTGLEKIDINDGTSSQECRFEQLPPVLFLSLARFQGEGGRYEKFNDRLDFPEKLYMDRYMQENRKIANLKREEAKKLKHQKKVLQEALEGYTKYGCSEPKVPLKNVLDGMLAFATSKQPEDLAPISANMSSAMMAVDSPTNSPKITPASSQVNLSEEDHATPMDVEEDIQAMPPPIVAAKPNTAGCDTNNHFDEQELPKPAPKYITPAESQVFQDCIQRWKEEIEQQIAKLESDIREKESQISSMYASPELMKRSYHLHAVMVHEGSIESGHYWAYVKDHKLNVWLKCNDIAVLNTNWADLHQESVGGTSSASAYSLVYVDSTRSDKWNVLCTADKGDEKMEQGALEALLQSLPNDLAAYVNKDNAEFESECREWDEKAAQNNAKNASESGISQGDSSDIEVVVERLAYVRDHALLSIEQIMSILGQLQQKSENEFIDDRMIVKQAFQHAKAHFSQRANVSVAPASQNVSQLGVSENTPTRLESFLVYLLRNSVSDDILLLALYEHFALPALSQEHRVGCLVKNYCDDQLENARRENPPSNELLQLREWHQMYHLFRVSAHCFVEGVDSFCTSKFDQSLELFCIAYVVSIKISETGPEAPAKTLRPSPVLRYTARALQEVHYSVIKQFKHAERLEELNQRIECLMCPALHLLDEWINNLRNSNNASKNSQNEYILNTVSKTTEGIRSEWCALLGDTDTVPSQANNRLTDILSKILDPPSQGKSAACFPVPRSMEHMSQESSLKLAQSYREAVRRMEDKNVIATEKW